MAIANLSVTSTFRSWYTTTNDMIDFLNNKVIGDQNSVYGVYKVNKAANTSVNLCNGIFVNSSVVLVNTATSIGANVAITTLAEKTVIESNTVVIGPLSGTLVNSAISVNGTATFLNTVNVTGNVAVTGNVGITGMTSITGNTYVAGPLHVRQILYSQTGATAANTVSSTILDDFEPTGLAEAEILNLTPTIDTNITGIKGNTSFSRLLHIQNLSSAYHIYLKSSNTGSSAGNRIVTPGDNTLDISPGGALTLLYSNTAARWRPLAPSVSGNTEFPANVHILGTLIVDGNTTANLNLTVNGNTVSNLNLLVNGNTTANLNLLVNGNTVSNLNLLVNGNTTANLNLLVNGNTTANLNLLVNGNTVSNLNLLVNGNTTANLNLLVNGNTVSNLNLLVNGNTTANSNLLVNGNTVANLNLLINGNTTANLNLIVSGNASVNGIFRANGAGAVEHQFLTSSANSGDNYIYVGNPTATGRGGVKVVAGATTGKFWAIGESYGFSNPIEANTACVLQSDGDAGLYLSAFHLNGEIRFFTNASTSYVGGFGGNGAFSCIGGSGGILSISDARLKTPVRPFTAGLDAIKAIQESIAVYRYRTDIARPKSAIMQPEEFVAPLAQSIQTVIPEAVHEDSEGWLSMSTGPLIYAMMNAIVELDAKIKALEEKQ